ncbi:MAG: hypothetical protein AAF740_01400 [Bacteroidota bacterium]
MKRFFISIALILLIFSCTEDTMPKKTVSYLSVKSYELPQEKTLNYTVVLSEGTSYEVKLQENSEIRPKDAEFALLDSAGATVLQSNLTNKPFDRFYFDCTETGVFQLSLRAKSDKTGQVEFGFYRP